MLIDQTGLRLSDGKYAIREAIEEYLRTITYGGGFNKNKLIDAVQSIQGVIDIELGECYARPHFASDYQLIKGNNYTAVSGYFSPNQLNNTLRYVV